MRFPLNKNRIDKLSLEDLQDGYAILAWIIANECWESNMQFTTKKLRNMNFNDKELDIKVGEDREVIPDIPTVIDLVSYVE